MFFLQLSCFFDDPADVGNLISGSSAFSETRLNIWKFTVHVLLKPGLENFESYFTSVWDECNYVVVWAFFGISFLYPDFFFKGSSVRDRCQLSKSSVSQVISGEISKISPEVNWWLGVKIASSPNNELFIDKLQLIPLKLFGWSKGNHSMPMN